MYETLSEALDAYDAMLDDNYGDFMGSYPASRVLREMDPIAYRVGFHDWLDSEEVDYDDLIDDGDDRI